MELELATLTERPCPGCGWKPSFSEPRARFGLSNLNFIGRDRPLVSPLDWSDCKRCHLQFVSRSPSQRWYLSQYEKSGETDPTLDQMAAYTALELWRKKMPMGLKSVLEIGCGQGSFLRALKAQGLQVCGTEPNENLRRISGLSPQEIIPPEELSQLSLRFEALSLQLSLEHLYEPLEILSNARQHLEDHAFLFVLYHSTTAWPHRLLKKKSPLYDVQHLQLFDPLSLNGFLRKLGFQVLSDEAYANQYPLAYWGQLLGLQVPGPLRQMKISLSAGNRVCVAQFQRKT